MRLFYSQSPLVLSFITTVLRQEMVKSRKSQFNSHKSKVTLQKLQVETFTKNKVNNAFYGIIQNV